MIKAVIFDCFGVLTTDGWLPFKRKYFGENADLHQQATDLNKQVDAGLISYSDFMTGVAKLAGVTDAEAEASIQNNIANAELFEFIQTLKPQYKIGFLSNAGANWLTELFSPEQVKLFDAISISSETGYVKPDERAYQDVVAKLDIIPSEAVFIDDQLRYCDAARDAGMQAIVYADFPQCKTELLSLLG